MSEDQAPDDISHGVSLSDRASGEPAGTTSLSGAKGQDTFKEIEVEGLPSATDGTRCSREQIHTDSC